MGGHRFGYVLCAMEDDLPALIRSQHARLRELLAELGRQPAVTEQILEPQLRARRRVLREIRETFVAQQSARLRHLWPALRAAWPDGRAHTALAWERTRRIEHRMVERQWFGDRDEAGNDLDARIASDIEEHLAVEASLLARLGGPPELVGIDTSAVARRMRDGGPWPTRPHPDRPRSQRLAAMTIRPLAVTDRLLDRWAPVRHAGGGR